MLVLLAAAISSPSEAPRPTPIGNEPWVTTEDYPSEAVRGAWHGRTSYELKVGVDGRVDDCSITQSSGHPVLDKKTCKILRKRARFEPPKDDQGNSVPSIFRSALNWRLPQESEGRETLVTFRRQDGKMTCSIAVDGRQRMIAQQACDSLVKAVRQTGGSLSRPSTFWLLDSTPLVPE